jgi:hypothetical protein
MAEAMGDFRGIKSLQPRAPVGAVLRVGRKNPDTGEPIEKDRFYIVTPTTERREFRARSGRTYGSPASSLHPDFRQFNIASAGGVDLYANPRQQAKGDGIRSLRGVIVHSEESDAERHYLRAMKLKGKMPNGEPWPVAPNRAPACKGDGENALRLFGVGEDGTLDYRPIPCPDRLCEFRQGSSPDCKAHALLLFMPRWKDGAALPSPLMKWSTGGWNAAASLAGLFQFIRGLAEGLHVTDLSLAGFPFQVTLSQKTDAVHHTSYPVVSFAPDGDPLRWLVWQAEQRAKLGPGSTVLLPAVTMGAREEGSAEALNADYADLVPGGIPSETVVAAPTEPQTIETIARRTLDEVLEEALEANVSQTALEERFGCGLHKLTGASQEAILAGVRAAIKEMAE